MTKFVEGQKVKVVGPDEHGIDHGMIGLETEIKSDMFLKRDGTYSVWNKDKSDYWFFRPSSLEAIPDHPEEIEHNGMIYTLKGPKPHEWKFGDVAVHEDDGVGIVVGVQSDDVVCFKDRDTQRMLMRPVSSLTFIRRADLSV